VISILAHRDAAQRALIQHEYRALYAEDLLKRLTSELTGKLEVPCLVFLPFFFIRKPDISCICSFCISDSSSVVDA